MDCRGWSTEETRCLISIWAEDSVQRKLGGSYRNRAIYEEISRKMEGNGYCRSWLQCQRKIKHLKNAFRKAKVSNNKSGRDRISCLSYDELDMVLGDRPSFCPVEGDVEDSELEDSPEEPPFDSTMDAVADAAVTLSNTTPAETQGDDGHSDDTTGPDASASQSSSASSSKRPSPSSGGQTRRKRSRLETTLEAFSKAMCSSKDAEVLLQMQRAQHAHEEKLFGMMMQSITFLASTMARNGNQHPPGRAPSYPDPATVMVCPPIPTPSQEHTV